MEKSAMALKIDAGKAFTWLEEGGSLSEAISKIPQQLSEVEKKTVQNMLSKKYEKMQ